MQGGGQLRQAHLQRGHDEGGHADVAGRQVFVEQLPGNGVALVAGQLAQFGNQGLQCRGQAGGLAGQGVQDVL